MLTEIAFSLLFAAYLLMSSVRNVKRRKKDLSLEKISNSEPKSAAAEAAAFLFIHLSVRTFVFELLEAAFLIAVLIECSD